MKSIEEQTRDAALQFCINVGGFASAGSFTSGAEWERNRDKSAKELVNYILIMNQHMAEQYLRHDYRSMWDIWGQVMQMAEKIISEPPKKKEEKS